MPFHSAINEDHSAAIKLHEVTHPLKFGWRKQVFAHVAQNHELILEKQIARIGKLPELITSWPEDGRTSFDPVGLDGVYVPPFVTLQQVAQIAKFPTRAGVHKQDARLLGDDIHAQGAAVVIVLGFPFHRRDHHVEHQRQIRIT